MSALPGLAIPVCFFLAMLENPAGNVVPLYTMIALLGGLTLPLYSICMAHMNDYLKPSQIIAASGTLVLILAVGMTLGPTLGALAIAHYGPEGIFYLLSTISAITVMTALFRLWSGQSRVESPTTVVPMAANLTPEATRLYPDASAQKSNFDA